MQNETLNMLMFCKSIQTQTYMFEFLILILDWFVSDALFIINSFCLQGQYSVGFELTGDCSAAACV